ncbi:hypothetical protein [Neisseria dumasiana]|uniref:hypothetical protein n=1 Tax=Neisseria dumasiana TaxID=1931275 RepID=UPI000BBDB047|nr:hypothetical protein [Neisseria dumasiana]
MEKLKMYFTFEQMSISLPCLALPCLALPCLALPCLALPCLALPCLAKDSFPLKSQSIQPVFATSCIGVKSYAF